MTLNEINVVNALANGKTLMADQNGCQANER